MAHALIEIVDEASGAVLPVGMSGLIRVTGESVFRGYFGGEETGRSFLTEDIGRLEPQGGLEVLGRRDAVIITGGQKVHPGEVEAQLRASGVFPDVVVMGLPDKEWGEVVVAWYPAARAVNLGKLALGGLAPYQRPKRYIAVADWPRTPQGKINRAALKARASTLLDPTR